MKFSLAALLPLAAAVAVPEPTAPGNAWDMRVVEEPAATAAPDASAAGGNPFSGAKLYANKFYASEVANLAIPSLANKALAPKASAVAKVPSFFWMDTMSKVPMIADFVADAKKTGANLIPLVVYDMPDRDCSALASNGELSIAGGGAAKYKEYIAAIKKQLQAASSMKFVLVVEPDSLANMITNMNVQKCSGAAATYKELTVHALKELNLPNVSMYLDAGHGGWLGWDANITPAAQLYAQIYQQAGKPQAVRGLATNVANYNAWTAQSCAAYTTPNKNCDEKRYVHALGPLLAQQGFPAHFIMDTSRNGVQPTKQQAWGNWCNVIGTGFGVRPSANTGDELLDAFVWIKPGGECDGTSDSSAPRYDAHCSSPDALQPAPQAGTWFQAYFEQLLANANPPF